VLTVEETMRARTAHTLRTLNDKP